MKHIPFRKYYPFLKGSWLTVLAYRVHIYMWMLGDVVSAVLMILLWTAIYRAQPQTGTVMIHGFTLGGMIQYVLVAKIATGMIGYTETFWNLSEDIRSGSVAMTLMKPISYRLKNVSTTIGGFFATFAMMTLPLMAVLYAVLAYMHLPLPSWSAFLMFLFTSFLGLIIMDTLDFLFGLSAIFTGALFGLGQIKTIVFQFLSGALIPLSFFPDWLNRVISFLPYKTTVATPISILLGQIDASGYLAVIALQVFWIVCLNAAAKLLFDRLIKHVVVAGG